MTNTALRGKSDAGNPHVRFDEGEVAPAAKPRRGSLLYKKPCIAMAALAATTFAVKGEPVSALAETAIAVDVRTEVCRAVGSAAIGYSPKWGGVTNAGAYVVLQKVVGGVTNTVDTFAADAESSYSYTPGNGDSSFVKFIHRVYS